ncbi:hypothetical protein [Chromobacterium subtsugae]|uniref:hypothetical protein n=1 Tax=Chromobacterium subtsugae TaxID=251747 RepID=UPI0009BA9F8D|nr:hypothetical protein [Chromobacterium subtsugae]
MSEFFKTAATLHVLEKLGENERVQDRQNRTIDDQNNRIADLEEQLRKAKPLDNSLPAPSSREMDLERRVQELEGLEYLLSRPMAEIAQKIPAFKDTYLKEQEILAQWILKQKAFAEIAMQYGQALGKTPDQVTAEANQAQEVVKDGGSKFGNNVDSETKNALGYTEKRQEQMSEAQRRADQENLNNIEKSLIRWKEEEEKRALTEEDFKKIDNLKSKREALKAKIGLA